MRAIVARLSSAIVLIGLFAAPAVAEVVRVEVQSRSDLAAGRAFGAAGLLREDLRQDLLCRRSVAAGEPHRHRHRQGAAQRRRQSRVLIRLFPDQAERHRARQWRRALRSVQSRREGDARLLQSRGRKRRSRLGRRAGRWIPDETRLHAAVGRLAVRYTAAPGIGARLCADGIREWAADSGSRPQRFRRHRKGSGSFAGRSRSRRLRGRRPGIA